jgi:hypothetical protein
VHEATHARTGNSSSLCSHSSSPSMMRNTFRRALARLHTRSPSLDMDDESVGELHSIKASTEERNGRLSWSSQAS